MRLLLIALMLVGGCGHKAVEWYPRVTAWKVSRPCVDIVTDNAARVGTKEPEFCRQGLGVLVNVKRNL